MKNQIIKQFNLTRRDSDKELYDGFYPWDNASFNFDQDWSEETAWRDGWHRRVWINIKDRLIFTFCEGDVILNVCNSPEEFYKELFEASNFYKEN